MALAMWPSRETKVEGKKRCGLHAQSQEKSPRKRTLPGNRENGHGTTFGALWSTMDPFAFCISFPEERGSSEARVEKGGILFLSARNERLYPLFRPLGLSLFPLLYQYVPGRIYFVWFFSFSCVRNRFLLPLDYHQRNREKDYGRKLRMGKIREAI